MHILYLNGIKISEVPISLPARVYGNSKMKLIDVVRGFIRLLKQAIMGRFCRKIFVVPISDGTMSGDAKEVWEAYWSTTKVGSDLPKQIYGLIATVYRSVIIRPNFNHFMAKHIKLHSFLLHAGCGGGEVDMDAVGAYHIIAYDISANAFQAAFKDPRFPPLAPIERNELQLSISVLSSQSPLIFQSEQEFMAQLRPNVDGLVIADGKRRALFLPSVWDQLPDPAIFVGRLKQKAGLATHHWSDSLQAWRFVTESVSFDELQ